MDPPPHQEVNVSADAGSHVTAPVLSHSQVQGDFSITTNIYHGTGAVAGMAPTPDSDPGSVILAYKESILHGYQKEYNSLPGEHALLADRYTKLLMVQRHRIQREREEEIRSRGDAFHQLLTTRESKAFQNISVDQFFSPMDTAAGQPPRAVILQGHSGMGKSFTVQKVMHDWTLGTLFAGTFDVLFHLKCSELNHCKEEKTMMELLNLESSFQPAMVEVLTKAPERVLFLVDGFDELRFSLDVPRLSFPSDAFTKAPVEATLSALFQGHIFFKSSLLVTSRSTASDKLSNVLKQPQRFIEILGFSEEGVQEYFRRFFTDENLYSQAYGSVRSNESLFAACFIPVVCWIVCTVLREQFENGENNAELTTTTSVFVHFVSTILEHHCQGLSQNIPKLLRDLGQLAERGILDHQILFERKQVQEIVPDPENIPFLCKFLMKKKVGKKTMFSFMHLSFQEFFTALFYATADEEEGQRRVENLLQRDVNGDHYGLLPVIQFLFGLSNKELGSIVTEELGLSIFPSIHAQLEEWLVRLNTEILKYHTGNRFCCDLEKSMDVFSCLFELQEEELMRKTMETWQSFKGSFTLLSRTDCWLLQHCFQYCPMIRCVDVNITAEKLRMLKPVFSRCEELELRVEDLSDNDVGDLVACLGDGIALTSLALAKRINLEEGYLLDMERLVESKLTDEGVRKILTILSKQNTVRWFELEVFSVTLSTVEDLFVLLQTKEFDNYVSFEAALLTDTEETDLRVFLFKICKDVFSDQSNVKCFEVSAEFVLSFLDPERVEAQARLLEFTLRLSLDAELASIDWRSFFYSCIKDNLELAEHVDSLMSCMSRMSSLEEVWIDVSHLNEFWATGILQLFLACPHLKNIECSLRNDSSISQNVSVERIKGKLRLSVRNYSRSKLILLSTASRLHLSLTCLILILPISPELQHLDWTEFFRCSLALEGLTDNPGTDEQVESLLCFLCRVPDLNGLRLDVFPLTERWASGLVSFIKSQPTLTTLKLFCGEHGYGTISEEGLHILQQSQHLLKGTLSVTGLKCRVPADQCPTHTEQEHPLERLELTFTADSVQEKDIHCLYDLFDYNNPLNAS